MTDLILHHYPTSPFAEKVRVALGIKGLAWQSVIIPVIMPKPDLMPLTGGYRKTPVLQIGADVYCDTQLILREIERRFPDPSLYRGTNSGLANALAFWSDRSLFSSAVGVAFASRRDAMPPEFLADRAKFWVASSILKRCGLHCRCCSTSCGHSCSGTSRCSATVASSCLGSIRHSSTVRFTSCAGSCSVTAVA